jgi:hypothetical protein
MNALALKEQEHSLLYPVKEELTGEQTSMANTVEQHDAPAPEGSGEDFGMALQHGLGEDYDDASDTPLSVYEAMVLSPKSMQHRTVAASPSHSSFSVASGVSSSATSHWDKQDTTKRMMRVPVIDRVMSKVARRISEIPRHKLLGRHQVILLGSGAYNPIHKMHLRMFYIARRYLEERTEYEVLGGLVSPSPERDHSAEAPPCHGAVGGGRFDGEKLGAPRPTLPRQQATATSCSHRAPFHLVVFHNNSLCLSLSLYTTSGSRWIRGKLPARESWTTCPSWSTCRRSLKHASANYRSSLSTYATLIC